MNKPQYFIKPVCSYGVNQVGDNNIISDMEDFTQTLQLTHEGIIHDRLWNKIQLALGKKEGIVVKRTGESGLKVSFLTYLYGKEYLIQLVKDTGFIEKVQPKKNILKRLLEKLAADNKTSFGNRRLNGCDLNKKR